MLSHRVRGDYGVQFGAQWRMTPESVVLHAGSIVFNGAFLTLMPWLYLGCAYVLMPAFGPDAVIRAIDRERATHVIMVPSQIVAVMASKLFTPRRLASLEMLLTLGAPLHLAHKMALMEALPGRFHELYGLTEGIMTILDRDMAPAKPGSVGVPMTFQEIKIVDDAGRALPAGEIGEICGRGPLLMSGYYKRPDLTDATLVDGWLKSGDLGYLDEDGFLYLVDRVKDMIVSGGVNVYPRDIEEIMVEHPDVAEATVFGVPDAKWGEAPIGAAVAKAGKRLEPETFLAWVNARVGAKYQRLRDVQVIDDMPRNVAGKILKRELRDRYVAEIDHG